MYVCVCRAVSDRRIREAVESGARSVQDLRRQFGLGTCCGKCVPAARALISATDEMDPAPKSAEVGRWAPSAA